MYRKFILMFFLSGLSPSLAWSSSLHTQHHCSYEDQMDTFRVNFDFTVTETIDSEGNAILNEELISQFNLNDTDIPSLREQCIKNRTPGRSVFVCPHRSSSGVTYQIYPHYSQVERGALEEASVIIWNANNSSLSIELECRQL